MLTSITLENFKGFREKTTIPLSPITMFFGPNSGGKSSILQAMLMMKQTAENRRDLDGTAILTQGNWVDLGHARNVFHGDAQTMTVGFTSWSQQRGTFQNRIGTWEEMEGDVFGIDWNYRLKDSSIDVVGLDLVHWDPVSQSKQLIYEFEIRDAFGDDEKIAELYPPIVARRLYSQDLEVKKIDLPLSLFEETIENANADGTIDRLKNAIIHETIRGSMLLLTEEEVWNESRKHRNLVEQLKEQPEEEQSRKLQWEEKRWAYVESQNRKWVAWQQEKWDPVRKYVLELSKSNDSLTSAQLKQWFELVLMGTLLTRRGGSFRRSSDVTRDLLADNEYAHEQLKNFIHFFDPDDEFGRHPNSSHEFALMREFRNEYVHDMNAMTAMFPEIESCFDKYVFEMWKYLGGGEDSFKPVTYEHRRDLMDSCVVPHLLMQPGELYEQATRTINRSLQRIQAISAAREVPDRFEQDLVYKTTGFKGEGTVRSLADRKRKRSVVRFLEQLDIEYGVEVKTETLGGTDVSVLTYLDHSTPGKNQRAPKDVGLGHGQILPILLNLADSGANHILMEPESHLHPTLQAQLMQLIVEQTAEQQGQSFIETHSVIMFLRLLKMVREGKLSSNYVVANYISRLGSSTELTVLKVTEEGKFDKPVPDKFFTQDVAELFS